MESSRRDGYDGYCTWGGALLQPELWGIHPKIAISGHKPPIFTRDNDNIHTYINTFIQILYIMYTQVVLVHGRAV